MDVATLESAETTSSPSINIREIPFLKDFFFEDLEELNHIRVENNFLFTGNKLLVFRKKNDKIVVFRKRETLESNLRLIELTDLFNNQGRSWVSATLGEGLYTSNTPNAYPLKTEGQTFVLALDIDPRDIFDCTQINENDTDSDKWKKYAVIGLGTRLLPHPPESFFKSLYGTKKAVLLSPELPYQLFYGSKLNGQSLTLKDDQSKFTQIVPLLPRWLLIRDIANIKAQVVGVSEQPTLARAA